MVKTSKSAIVLGLLALCFNTHADGVYTRTVNIPGSASSSGGGTSGTISTGTANRNAYYTGTNTIGSDNGIIDSGGGSLTINGNLLATSATGTVSATFVNSGQVSSTNINGTTGTFTNVAGTLTTAAQPNVTSVGTLTGLQVNGAISATSIAVTNTLGFVSATIGNFSTISATASYIVSPVFGGPNASTTAAFVFKQTGTGSSTNGLNVESPAGVALNLFADSSQVSIRRNGAAAGGAIQITNTGMGVGGAGTQTASLTVAGPISATSFVNVGSPTTIPSCTGANQGVLFMNLTTHCLNYCDGTAARQITSAAATCT